MTFKLALRCGVPSSRVLFDTAPGLGFWVVSLLSSLLWLLRLLLLLVVVVSSGGQHNHGKTHAQRFALCLVRRNWNMRVQFSLCAYFLDVSFLEVPSLPAPSLHLYPGRNQSRNFATAMCKWSPERQAGHRGGRQEAWLASWCAVVQSTSTSLKILFAVTFRCI